MQERDLMRFLDKVRITPEGCREWTASTVRDRSKTLSYGQFWLDKKLRLAHRVSFEHYNGPIPPGMTIDHICRNPLCVHPKHLRLLSLKENILCGTSPVAVNSAKTHCPKGHPYSGENLKPRKIGRQCRACFNEWNRLNRKHRVRTRAQHALGQKEP